jgi:hypothetical protein
MRPYLLSLLLLTAPATFASDKPAPKDPVAFGIMTHHKGCVIFEEWRRTTGNFYGIALATRTDTMLTVLESQNYKLDKMEFPETAANLDDLIRRARAGSIKYVKIPEKHSPEQLEKARAMCRQDE